MKTYTINKGLRYYADMSIILNPIKEYLKNYNFLITSVDCNYYTDKRINYEDDYIFLPINDFLEIVNAHEIQFIWGIFCNI